MTTELSTLKQTLTSDKMREQFAAALPKHLTPERFTRIAITALTRTPKLVECTQASLMRCLLDLSSLGLEPDGRRAHLIPYKDQCTLIIDWKGLAELAMRSGIIAKLHADTICENDDFAYDLGEITRHVVNWKAPRGAMYAAYAMAVTKDGAKFCAVMTKDEIDAVRQRSRSSNNGPWVTDYNEMAKKTAFRRLSKWLPLSAEFRDALDKDQDEAPIEREVTPAKVPLFPAKEAEPLTLTADGPTTYEILASRLVNEGLTWEQVAQEASVGGFFVDLESPMEQQAPDALADIVSAWGAIVSGIKKGGAK